MRTPFLEHHEVFAIEAHSARFWFSDKEQFYQKCKLIFEKFDPTFGNFYVVHLCKENLQEQPKSMAWCKVTDEENEIVQD